MKTFIVNLPRREDRKRLFNNTNRYFLRSDKIQAEFATDVFDGEEIEYADLQKLYFDTYKEWRDPIHGTHLTKGEVGCFLTHYHLWKKCIQLNEPIIILEDDAVCTPMFDVEEVEGIIKEYNFLYLAWSEQRESQPIPNNEKLVKPVYPYWTLAYIVTPEAAKILINSEIERNIIPVDEYLPIMMNKLNPAGYIDDVFHSQGRDVVGTDCDPKDRYQSFIDFNVHPITIGTDESKCNHLMCSGEYNNIQFNNLGKGITWKGGDIENSQGGGQKLNILKKYISTLPDDDVVLFCDAYDVFVADNLNEFIYRYLEIGHKVLFAAEQYCWPDKTNAPKQSALTKKIFPGLDTKYQYLNSGVFMGKVSELKRIFKRSIKDNGDDQLYCQEAYLSEKYDIAIDTDNYLFQCHEEDAKEQKGMIFNPHTRCYNLCYHGNGGKEAKDKFNQLYRDFYGSPSPILYIPTHDYDKLRDDIILVDFLTESMCDSIIELSERHGGYKNDEGDDVPGQEIRLHEIGLSEKLEFHWKKCVAPILHEEFHPCNYYGVRDAFIIKYTMEGQRDLRLHSDASLVTGSVKLNDSYTGGELYFPRQDLSNKDIPVGDCILFPGQVSHPHTSKELKSGTKFSLTIWTKRNKHD